MSASPQQPPELLNRPRSYDLKDPAEVARLLREVRGYLHTSRNDGTDQSGRVFALAALTEALKAGWTLTPPPYEDPLYGPPRG